jgi:hypothetical protein
VILVLHHLHPLLNTEKMLRHLLHPLLNTEKMLRHLLHQVQKTHNQHLQIHQIMVEDLLQIRLKL